MIRCASCGQPIHPGQATHWIRVKPYHEPCAREELAKLSASPAQPAPDPSAEE